MASATADPQRPPTTARSGGRARTGGDLRARVHAALRLAAPALVGYTAVRLVGVALLHHLAERRGVSPGTLLHGSWDARWYQDVAAHGYDRTIHGTGGAWHHWSNLAFFPLYPWLCRAADAVLPVGLAKASWAVSLAASLAAAWLIFLVGHQLYGRRTGVVLAVLWGCLPHAVVESMAYTESLFTALSAASLLAVLRRHWARAGLLAALAGLTRPTGLALAAAVGAVAVPAAVRELRGPGRWRTRLRRAGPPALALLLAPAGWLAFVGWVGLRLHRPDGYAAVQAEWGNRFGRGGYLVRRIRWVLLGERGGDVPVAYAVVTLVVLGSVLLLALCATQRQPLPLLLFSGALLGAVALGRGVFIADARFLLPAFPLLAPPARALARSRGSTALLVLTAAALSSAVYGVHLCLVWNGPP